MLRKFVVVVLLILVSAGSTAAQESSSEQFSGALAYEHIVEQMAFGARIPATSANIEAGNVILNYLDDLGWTTSEDWHVIDFGPLAEMDDASRETFDYWTPITVGDLFDAELTNLGLDEDRELNFDPVLVPIRNLVASYGSGPIIIIGAHYDSRVFADKDLDETRRHEPVPGANDGGSGVGVLLEMARVISEYYMTNYELRFVFFDAEDQGTIPPWSQLPFAAATLGYSVGSLLYVEDMTFDQYPVYMLLVDLVGDFDQRFPIEGFSYQIAPEIVNGIWQTAADLGYAEYFPFETRSAIIDDHLPFYQRGIPAVDIIDLEYAYWDTTQDTLDHVSAESLERVGRVLIAYLESTGVIERTQ
jgi:hypothetical protein